jgi:L-histidine N-alpha-methyltransferase
MSERLESGQHRGARREASSLLADVLTGLGRRPRTLPCKYFYDRRGSELFEAICALPEYYPTRTELAIMRENMQSVAGLLGEGVFLVEPGSGASVKTRLLLRHLPDPAAYAPVDISVSALDGAVEALQAELPELEVLPVATDFTRPFLLPLPRRRPRRIVSYFPGSTIGNFEPPAAETFLRSLARLGGPDGAVLIGVDLHKSRAVLERAYNDAEGVTAAFNLNILRRINRELGASFEPGGFSHVAFYDEAQHRIEMHLESSRRQEACVAGRVFRFERGERIHTESSYKYTLPAFAELAGRAGLTVQQVWTDPEELFSVQYLVVAAA